MGAINLRFNWNFDYIDKKNLIYFNSPNTVKKVLYTKNILNNVFCLASSKKIYKYIISYKLFYSLTSNDVIESKVIIKMSN